MRILAIFASAFSAAVFLANYLLPEAFLLLGGGLLALLGLGLWFSLRSRTRPRRLCALLCAGAAVGLVWTAVYTAIFFQPARELDNSTVRLTATVADWPKERDGDWSVLVRADTDSFVRLSAILYVDEQGADLRPGDEISVVGRCALGDRTSSGQEITYYTAKGIFLRVQTYGRLDVQRPEHVPVRYWPAVLSKYLKESIDTVFPEDVSPLVRGLVTGNRDNLTDEFTSSLQRVGLAHTVAVSGMHLAFLAAMVAALMGRGKRSTALVTILFVLAFCGVAGNTPSVTRAAVMILLLQIAPLLGRERDGPTALAFALMLLLAWNPFSAAHVGLQLSFGAVAGILLVSDTIQNWMLHKLRLDKRPKKKFFRLVVKVPRFLVSVLCATLGASVLTVPLVAIHFQSFSLIAPVSNLLTLWAVALLFLGGLVLGILGMFQPDLAAVLAMPFTGLARWLIWVVESLGRLPMASIPLTSPYYRAWVIFLCLLLAATLLSKGGRRPLIPLASAAGTLIVCVLFTSLTFRAGELTAAVLDVGQGQSVLLQAGNYLTLVDCGGDGPDNPGDVAADYLHSLGRNSLDLLVVSHYHKDHANGIPQLLKRVNVSAIALPDVEEEDPLRREILELAEERGVEVWLIREDTVISLGEDQEFTLYAPMGGGTGTNELGLTVLATAGDSDVLLTGDMNAQGERELLDQVRLPDIELLVAGHHGSKYSTTQELLEATRPETAVISVGAGNRYGHPARETLERLDRAGTEIYRTDLQGTVVIRFQPET